MNYFTYYKRLGPIAKLATSYMNDRNAVSFCRSRIGTPPRMMSVKPRTLFLDSRVVAFEDGVY
jgi:hypothetical protein